MAAAPEVSMLLNLLLAGVSVYLVIEFIKLVNTEGKLKVLERQSNHNEKLSTIIRTIKHDIDNQITVIDGLYQLDKREEAQKYIKQITSEFDWIAKVLDFNQPELASLMVSKVNEATSSGIDTKVKIDSKMKNCDSLTVIKLTRVLGNLIDNALYALKEQKEEEKILCVEIYDYSNYLLLEVENSGTIPEDIKSKLFERGFTTKGAKGNGFGLNIVKELVQSMGGEIKVLSENNRTKFTVEIITDKNARKTAQLSI